MTDDELAFLGAASAEPDEDTLRLAYADWLDEQGAWPLASQAAFVRLQVRRSRTDFFDPERATLLEQEAQAFRKHQRSWNGRLHRLLQRYGYTEPVDARRGLIRGWRYHRGMVAHLAAEAAAVTPFAYAMFALGPVAHLRLATWPIAGWETGAADALASYLATLKVVSVAGPQAPYPPPDATRLKPFAGVPILDLRALGPHLRPNELYAHARLGALSPVVLFQGTVPVTRTRWGGGTYTVNSSDARPHVIDPFGKWDALRLGFADLTGQLLDPVPYQGASR